MALTAEQLERRKIGGSDAPLIMAGEMYGRTLHDLWLEKTGQKEPEDLSRVLRVQMGTFTEPFNLRWYEQETGHHVATDDKTHVHSSYEFATAHPDGFTNAHKADKKPDGVWEAKHIGAFNKADPSETYYAQVQHNMAVLGRSYAHLSVFKGTDTWSYYEVDRDDEYIKILIERETAFWFAVESMTPPAGFDPVPAPKINPEKVVCMRESNSWGIAAGDWLEHRDAAKRFDAAKKDIKELCEEDAAVTHGHGIIAKRTKRGLAITEGELSQ